MNFSTNPFNIKPYTVPYDYLINKKYILRPLGAFFLLKLKLKKKIRVSFFVHKYLGEAYFPVSVDLGR